MNDKKNEENDSFLKNNNYIFKKYKPLKKIGSGSFGNVYSAIKLNDKSVFAMKTEKRSAKKKSLESEAYYLYILQGFGIPKFISFGHTKNYNILIESLLDKSLYQYFFLENKKCNLSDVCLIGLQILDRFEWIHSKDIVYRDVKPENFLFGLDDPNVIYIIDFGLCKKYRSSKTGKHILPKYTGLVSGTMRFVSPNVIKGKHPSRRDDLISLGYILIFLYKRELPWDMKISNFTREIYLELVYLKQTNGCGKLFNGIPKEFMDYIKYTRNLKFEQNPDYSYLRSLLNNILFKLNINYKTLTFSWFKSEKQKLAGIPNNRCLKKSSTHNRIYKNIMENSIKKKRVQRSEEIADNRNINNISKNKNFPISSMESIPKNIFNIKSKNNNYNTIASDNLYNKFQKGIQINFQINSVNNKETKLNMHNLEDDNLGISSSFKINQNNFSNASLSNNNYSSNDNKFNIISEGKIHTSPTNYNLKSIINLRKIKLKNQKRQTSINYPTNIETQINNIIFSSQVKINNNCNNNININNNNKKYNKYNKIKKKFKVKKLNHCPTNNLDFDNSNKIEINLCKDITYQSPVSKNKISHDFKKTFSSNQFIDTKFINNQKDKLLTHIQSSENSVFNDNLSIKNNKFNNLYNINKCLKRKNFSPLNPSCKSEIACKINKEKEKDLNKKKSKISYLFRRNEKYLYHSKFNNKNNLLEKNNEREYSTKNNTIIGNSLYKSQISENNSYIKNFLK